MDVTDFKKEVLPLKNKLYRFAFTYVKDEELAKDVVQECLIKVWEKRSEMTYVQNLEAWCMQITRNKALDKLRSKHVKRTDQFEVELDTRKERDTPYAVTERSELMDRIQTLIDDLPQRQREVMQLRDIEGYTYKEIAENLDIDINLVKTNLFRARRKIKENLIKVEAYGLQAG
jgi:RNA polymerase sigma-70 factor (family 1)